MGLTQLVSTEKLLRQTCSSDGRIAQDYATIATRMSGLEQQIGFVNCSRTSVLVAPRMTDSPQSSHRQLHFGPL